MAKVFRDTHYYPFGLTMAGISATAIGKLENKFKFNDGNELQSSDFSDRSGLEWCDANYRYFDPQVGRFLQMDPIASLAFEESVYHFSNNNPIIYNDALGLTPNHFNGFLGYRGWIEDPEKGVYFDPKVHGPGDVKPGQKYLGEEIIIKDENGQRIGFGNDQGGISFNVNLAEVIVTPANNYSKVGERPAYRFPLTIGGYYKKGTDYSDYGKWGDLLFFLDQQLSGGNIKYDYYGNVIDVLNIRGGTAPSAAFGKLNPKDALKLAKALKNLVRKGRAPKGVERIDIPKLDPSTGLPLHGQQPHLHLKDGRALNFDGTWKHGGGEITNKIVKWIQENL